MRIYVKFPLTDESNFLVSLLLLQQCTHYTWFTTCVQLKNKEVQKGTKKKKNLKNRLPI